MLKQASALFGAYLALAYGATAPRVSAPAGTFVGQTMNVPRGGQYNHFRGIPFAEAPVGALRFKPTVPRENKLEGEYNATEFKPFCLQINMIPNDLGDGDEDCLYLNVYAPIPKGGDAGASKKVLVWFYGGGNMNGASDFYIPGEIVAFEDIIVVTANYRVGILGFMSTLSGASPGNYGLWDMVAALQWVQDNIHAFGGDPQAVTVSGQSAGAIDTSFVTLSPKGKGLFARSWSMSGTTGVDNPSPMAADDRIMALPLMVARREGCLADGAADPQSDAEWHNVVECLRQVPVARFANMTGFGVPYFGVVIDGDFLPKTVKEMFLDETYLTSIGFTDRDYMVSLCYNEGGLFNQFANTIFESEPENPILKLYINTLLTHYGEISPETEALIVKYYLENYEVNPLADFGTDGSFHIPVLEYANAATKAFGSKESRVHMLRFVNFPDFLVGPYQGTLHGFDLLYMFEFHPDIEWLNQLIDYKIDASKWSQSDTDLKSKYQKLVASFVKTGHPTTNRAGDGTPVEWPTYTVEGGHYLVFNETPTVKQHLKADRLELFTETIPQWIQDYPVHSEEGGNQYNGVLGLGDQRVALACSLMFCGVVGTYFMQ